MRIQTDDGYEWRTDLYDRTADRLGEGTRSGGIDGTREFTCRMLDTLEEAANHPDMTNDSLKCSLHSESSLNIDLRQASISID